MSNINLNQHNSHNHNIYADIIAGGVQATLVTLTGYPFDLIKARMQTKIYASSYDSVIGTIKNEGVFGLYRGSAMPFLSHMIKRPIQYPISEWLKSKLESTSGNAKNKNTLYNYAIGGFTGMIGPIFGTPLQVVKVYVQTSTDTNVKNSFQYILENYKKNGVLGFYRGFIPTVAKDSIFGMSFVGNYYTFRDYLGSDKPWKNFVSGASAHCITWFVFIPIDYVKTVMQKSESKISIYQIVTSSYKNHGICVFWKGVIPACLRTIPVSGVAMVGYEYVRQLLYDSQSRK